MKRVKLFFLIIFFLSGITGLIYQVVWERMLTTYFGVENISITLIISNFMFGLGIGSLIGGRLADKVKDRISLYSGLELLIGLFGLISIPFINFLGERTAGSDYLTSALLIFTFLSIPTILMGMTFPLLVKIFDGIVNDYLNSISKLYFVNTLGAAFGALLSTFVIISFWGLSAGIFVAVTINLLLALALYFQKDKAITFSKDNQISIQTVSEETNQNDFLKIAYFLVFITGFIAIGYEMIWFRLISILTKASPYSFSTVLFVYLIGIAIGSYTVNGFISKYNWSIQSKQNLFFGIQFLIAFTVLASCFGFYFLESNVEIFEYLVQLSFNNFLHPNPGEPGIWAVADIFIWPIFFILVPTILMGASFPLISSLALSEKGKEGISLGKTYFFNILGNVAGAIITGFVLLKYFGTEQSIMLLSIVGSAFLFLVNLDKPIRWLKPITAIFIISLIFVFPATKGKLYGSIFPEQESDVKYYIQEGIDGLSTVMEYPDGSNGHFINGLGHGKRPYAIFHYEAIELFSHTLKIDSILIIGFGAGNFVEVALKLPSKPHITLVELSENVLENEKNIPAIKEMLNNDRVEVIINDGRRYLYNVTKKFDVILMDPLRATTSYSNNLYSTNFFNQILAHLSDDGTFLVWLSEHQIIPNTLAAVFPYVRQYDFFTISSKKDLSQNEEFKENLLMKYDSSFQESLLAIDKRTKLLRDQNTIKKDFQLFPVNDDLHPNSEYYLGGYFKEILGVYPSNL